MLFSLIIKHESYEIELVEKVMSQDEVHEIATKKYNYGEKSEAYYVKIN